MLPAGTATLYQNSIRAAEAAKTGKRKQGSGFRELAQTAVGRGIRHSFVASGSSVQNSAGAQTINQGSTNSLSQVPQSIRSTTSSETSHHDRTPGEVANIQECLSELTSNYHRSLASIDADPTPLSQMQNFSLSGSHGSSAQFGGFLSRNSSLVDLAMIADRESDDIMSGLGTGMDIDGLGFVDFPNPDLYPLNMDQSGSSSENHHSGADG